MAGGFDELVSFFSPGVFDAFATGIMLEVVLIEGANNGLRTKTLAGGVEIGGVWI